jgi:hypothetical protein
MTLALALLIMASPFLVAAALSWAAHRSGILTVPGRLADYEANRAEHDLDAVRTRFQQNPAWPTAGALGERR